MNYLNIYFALIVLSFYIIGSLPTGYILVKLFSKKDLTKEGSGNVGTLNAFIVTNSRILATTVFLIDILKGLIPVFILLKSHYFSLEFTAAASCFLIIGHNFPIWLKFKGGRGLATTAGIFLLINSFLLILWIIVWIVMYLFRKSVLVSNLVATLSMPVFSVIFLIGHIKYPFYPGGYFLSSIFVVYTIVVSLLISLKHLEVFSKILPLKAAN